jgi:hypothetical protein
MGRDYPGQNKQALTWDWAHVHDDDIPGSGVWRYGSVFSVFVYIDPLCPLNTGLGWLQLRHWQRVQQVGQFDKLFKINFELVIFENRRTCRPALQAMHVEVVLRSTAHCWSVHKRWPDIAKLL